MLRNIVYSGHHVFKVINPPAAPCPPQKLFTVARRTARIGIKDNIAASSPKLKLILEIIPIRGVRSAMHTENKRITSLCRIITAREHYPAFDHCPVFARVANPLRSAPPQLAYNRIIQSRELFFILPV